MKPNRALVPLLVLVPALAGCPAPPAKTPPPCGSACPAGTRCDTTRKRCVLDLPDRCTAGTEWASGEQVFQEATQAWGLTGVEGVRISVTDIDGDGWADLSVRRAGYQRDDLSSGGTRATWLLRNTENGTFQDVTESSGFIQDRQTTDPTLGRPGEVVVWADVDNDGDLDAFTGVSMPTGSGETSELMLNDGTGHFTLGPTDSQIRETGRATAIGGASFTDVNRDGRIDLWVVHGAVGGVPTQDRLYIDIGGGEMVDGTETYGLLTKPWGDLQAMNDGEAYSVGWGADACDLNGDGFPELLAASYGRAPNHLWQATVDAKQQVKYLNRSVDSGYAYDQRMDWHDNESARCWCHLHPTDTGCAGVPPPQYIRCQTDADAFRWNNATDQEPYRLGGNSATAVCADLDGDGDLDLLTTEIRHWDVGSSSDPSEILVNDGKADVHFTRPGNDVTGLTRPHTIPWDDGDMTAAVFDFDNDGRPDIYIGSSDYPGTRGWLYHQKADGTFEPVPIDVGIDHKSSHGIAVADFDRDGDLDVVVGHSRVRCSYGNQCYPTANVRYFENVFGQDGNWIQLHLVGGPKTNRAAIGARVTVVADGHAQTQEVGGGYGHYGIQQDMVLHFGLGASCMADVTIRWPDQKLDTQTFTVPTGYRYQVEQGAAPVVAD